MVKPSEESTSNRKSPTKGTIKSSDIIKNNFTMYQMKKMIGKKLILLWSGIDITIQDKNSARLTKTKILETTTKKNLVITTFCNQGVLYVIRNIDIFLALSTISYKELEISKCNDVNVIIIQYPKLSKSEIKELINQ